MSTEANESLYWRVLDACKDDLEAARIVMESLDAFENRRDRPLSVEEVGDLGD